LLNGSTYNIQVGRCLSLDVLCCIKRIFEHQLCAATAQ
jgi:hypothetical protein